MKKTKIFIAIILGILVLGSCALCIALLGHSGDVLSKKEAKQLKGNAKVRCQEAHKGLVKHDRYKNAILLETVFVYIDTYDESTNPDVGSIYSKYQLEDGTIEYVYSQILDMKGLGELTDNSYIMQPFVEREEYYLEYRAAATTGKLREEELKSVGDGVYYREGETSSTYYFMIDVENIVTSTSTESDTSDETSTTTGV